jgi:hypothetical protein
MADQRKEFDPLQPNLPGGGMNSEHEIEDAGMRHSTTDKSTWTEEDRKRSEQGSMENIRVRREQETGDPEQSTVRNLRTTSMTKEDEQEQSRGKRMAPRTPQEMDLADELGREPVRSGLKSEEEHNTGRGGG